MSIIIHEEKHKTIHFFNSLDPPYHVGNSDTSGSRLIPPPQGRENNSTVNNIFEAVNEDESNLLSQLRHYNPFSDVGYSLGNIHIKIISMNDFYAIIYYIKGMKAYFRELRINHHQQLFLMK